MATTQGQTFSYAQLEQLWEQAGGTPSYAPLMAAIAEAESGGHSWENNTTDNGGTQTSWGLWQISDGTHNQPVPNIDDPLTNAKAAVAKFNSQGLTAWGTYDSGAYRKFLGGADSNPAGTVTLDSSASSPGGQSSPIGGIPNTMPTNPGLSGASLTDPFGALTAQVQWLGEFAGWAIFILIIFQLGIVLLILGTVLFALVLLGKSPTDLTGVLASTPEGRIAAVAATRKPKESGDDYQKGYDDGTAAIAAHNSTSQPKSTRQANAQGRRSSFTPLDA